MLLHYYSPGPFQLLVIYTVRSLYFCSTVYILFSSLIPLYYSIEFVLNDPPPTVHTYTHMHISLEVLKGRDCILLISKFQVPNTFSECSPNPTLIWGYSNGTHEACNIFPHSCLFLKNIYFLLSTSRKSYMIKSFKPRTKYFPSFT